MTIYSTWYCILKCLVTCWFSIHAGFSVLANLNCTPQQPYVCAGDEIICNCTAFCNETIMWSLPTESVTHVCNSCGPYTSSAVRVEVIACNGSSCSDTFTSHLSYNVSLRMGSSIQIDCSITPESPRPDSPPLPGCSLMTDPSQVERNSRFTWCVANCTGKYIN